jgi:two-component system, chemotaxis family, chemotaxis protein CheY
MSFNVMIVDDSGAMRSVIKKIIIMSGFNMNLCLEAGNGREALERLKGNWVDAIISDLNMPEMGGVELLHELSRDALYQTIPTIIVSTEGSGERMKEAFNSGAKGFIKKPFLPEEIRMVLYNVIGVGTDGEYQDDSRHADEGDF